VHGRGRLSENCPESPAQAQQLANSILRAVATYAADEGKPLFSLVAAADADGDGMLSQEEFASFVARCRVGMGEEAVAVSFAAFDSSGEGEIESSMLVGRVSTAAALGLLGRKYDASPRLGRSCSASALAVVAGLVAFAALAFVLRERSRAGVLLTQWGAARSPVFDVGEHEGVVRASPSKRWPRLCWDRSEYAPLAASL